MIVFSGVISDEIQTKTMKMRNKYFFFLFIIILAMSIIISGIFIFVFLIENVKEWLIASAVIACVVVILGLWNPRKKLPFHWEYRITIEEKNIIVESPLWTKRLQKAVKKIKKVFDTGDCYYIIYSDIINSIVCQKDLLKEGSLQEFETIFAGKIIKKQSI